MKPNRTMKNKAKQLGITPKQALRRPKLLRRLTISGLSKCSPE